MNKNKELQMADVKKQTPAAIVIFGITGDLARRKLLPALYNLRVQGLLGDATEIIGVTRSGTTADSLVEDVKDRVGDGDAVAFGWLRDALRIVTMDITQAREYTKLKDALHDHEARTGVCTNRLFYLAVPSQTFGSITKFLGDSGLMMGCEHRVGESRLLIEKPFGYDLESAEELIATLSHHVDENQIYRVDHYLAKETVQNILTFRFANPLFQAMWNSSVISAVTITAAESIGIEGRVAFYEQTGALRDIIQGHLLQILALVAMEQPASMSADDIHAAKLDLLHAIKPIRPDQVATHAVRGQYAGYHEEVGNHSSIAETYAAIRVAIDKPRWKDVPILIRSGKAMAEKVTEITLTFQGEIPDHQNALTIRIQPDEGISLELQVKKPGFEDQTERVQMSFCYSHQDLGAHPDAYERVLVDALRGDKTLFATSGEVLAAWRVVEAVLHAWGMGGHDLATYVKGSWGPHIADELAMRAGVSWTSRTQQICPVSIDTKESTK